MTKPQILIDLQKLTEGERAEMQMIGIITGDNKISSL